MRRMVWTRLLSWPFRVGWAIRCRMISLSTVVWKIEPRASSSSRSWAALVRLPLWAMAIWPRAQSTVERLGVAQVRRAGGGIAGVADGHLADQVVQDVAVEDLRHQAHALVRAKLPAVGGDDAGALLAAMLQGVEAVVGQLRGVRMAVNAEDAAIMFGIFLHQQRRLSG